jgi:hypothetical protein
MNKTPASLRSDFSKCRFAPESLPVCFGIDADFSGIRSHEKKEPAGGRLFLFGLLQKWANPLGRRRES